MVRKKMFMLWLTTKQLTVNKINKGTIIKNKVVYTFPLVIGDFSKS